jgi:ligand-binding sensor domain-containing protein/serine phosphatase RsbU (regulator of sigma subunit)
MSAIKVIKRLAVISVWLMLLLFLPGPGVNAQNYFFDNYSIKEGLSEQKVYKLLQDSKDYIWLGTANGLSRFDGKKFENFTTRNNLATGGVQSISEDSLGCIWFGHLGGGITRYNGSKFEQVSFDSIKVIGDITSIVVIKNKIWFTSVSGGAIQADFPVKDIGHIKAKQFRGKEKLSDQVYGSALLRDGSFICIADAGLRKFNTADKRFEIYRMPHLTTYFNTTCLLEDIKGNLWFGTYNGGIYKYIMSESRMEVIDLPKEGVASNWITCLKEDRKGRIWVGTRGGGVVVFDGQRINKYNSGNGLLASKIYDIIEDKEGNILIADESNGLTIFKGDAFETFNDNEILPDPNVNSVFQDSTGNLWLGTNAGLVCYSAGNIRKPVIFRKSDNFVSKDIRFIKRDRRGNLWMGANDGGVILFNMKTSRFESQPYINSQLYTEPQIKALEIDNQNNLWIGTLDGLRIGSENNQNIRRCAIMDSITVTTVTALYLDRDGNMWIGHQPVGKKSGLIKYNAAKGEFKQVPAFSGIIPRTLVMDNRKILWVGTGQGLIALRNDSVISTVTQDDGLLSNSINLLETANDGSIYIGTNIGLNRYFPVTNRIFSYTKKNGFTGIEAKPNAVYKTPSGDLWFGTANGAVHLRTSVEDTRLTEPLTHISGMQINYKERPMNEGLKLTYNEKSVQFDYYSICLTNPDLVRYKVKLDGADEVWRMVDDQTRAFYPALPPGKYTFNVLARNSQGIWNNRPVSFHFVIKPPFYQTWWFVLLVAVILVLFVVTYIKIREKNLIREKQILEEKVEERTAEVVMKSVEIEEKNRDITASIRYAERIQQAMLPREDTFQETFVLFMPKDIVSGDFYWMYDNGDQQFIAVVDCTGHGVPGAFMSIIGHNSLNKVVREYGLTRPSAIVDQLNIEVMKALLQRHEKKITDGMDLALIAFNKKTRTLEFAGAFNPLYLIRKGEAFVYKGDRFPIGMTTADEKKNFTNQTIDVQPGDMLYMCTDGYADQFGSPEAKKYKSYNVKKFLSTIWDLPVNEQKERLETEILKWKGDLEQVDDILFIGTKIP